MSKPTVLAVVSDLHTNSTVGLVPPTVDLDDGGQYKASKDQRWLWRNWRHFWATAAATAKEHGANLIGVVNGDSLDGDHHGTPQIITRNPNDQLLIAAAALQPMLDVVDAWIMVRGTEAHVGKSSAFEEHLAADCGALEMGDNGRRSVDYLVLDVNGVRFEIKHHPESGDMRPWTRGNGATRIAEIVTRAYMASGDRPPHVAIRSHRHVFSDSARHTRPVYVVCLPSWQFPTNYVHRLGLGGTTVPTFGGALFVCRDGNYEMTPHLYTPARPRPTRIDWESIHADARTG